MLLRKIKKYLDWFLSCNSCRNRGKLSERKASCWYLWQKSQ